MDEYQTMISKLFETNAYPDDAFDIKKAFDGKPILIYGAGECSHWFVEIVMKMNGYKPLAVLDRAYPEGGTYEGIPAFSPASYRPTDDEKREAVVVICVGRQELHDEILTCLHDMGFQNVLFLRDIYEIHNPFSRPAELFEKGFPFYLEHKDQVFEAYELLEDDASREVYTRCLQTHMTRKPVPIPCRPREEQYFPKDIPLKKGHASFVSCGSYDGDTVRLLNQTCGKVKDVVCFEPEPLIFQRLVSYLTEYKDELAENVWAIPCAVYENEGIMPFISGTGLGSRLDEGGESRVQSVALDHVLHTFEPTFICMDVEGVEPNVLRGAEYILRTCRPDLGICVYHSPSHLWEIPIYLNSLGLDYRFYLRNYTSFSIETVLYAAT